MNLDRLREETREDHEAVEALVPLMSPDLTRDRYIQMLRRMHAAVHGWETWAKAHAPQQYRSLVEERRRSHLIEQDLEFLKAEPVCDMDHSIGDRLSASLLLRGEEEATVSVPGFLGAMYVVEGSTLGGQHIARYVEDKLLFVEGQGDAYFRGYADQTGSMWRSFKQVLAAVPEEQGDELISAAKVMFKAFGDTMGR